ncbi:hypothetical protein K439DRAFT_1157142 [Ramaria rubella]|nr:hypothetical protein K439DRAFT_1157142 [Ramaria rubella]
MDYDMECIKNSSDFVPSLNVHIDGSSWEALGDQSRLGHYYSQEHSNTVLRNAGFIDIAAYPATNNYSARKGVTDQSRSTLNPQSHTDSLPCQWNNDLLEGTSNYHGVTVTHGLYSASETRSDKERGVQLLQSEELHTFSLHPETPGTSVRSQHAWIQTGTISTSKSLNHFILPVTAGNVTSFLCGWAGCKHPVGFCQKTHLVTHIRSVHLQEKPFRCIKCGVSFARKQEATRHVNGFNHGKKYKCSSCHQCFFRKHARDNHEDICMFGEQGAHGAEGVSVTANDVVDYFT